MKSNKFRNLQFLFIAVAISVSLLSSCKKDDNVAPVAPIVPVSPSYVGTWGIDTSYVMGSFFLQMKSIVVLSVEDFSISTSVLNPLTNSMMDISILKGKLSVKDSVMTQEIREFKVVDFPENGIPNFSLVTYKEGTPEFDKYLMDKHMDKIVVSVYSVSGNHITLKTDDNKDGDFLDEGEIVTLTKK